MCVCWVLCIVIRAWSLGVSPPLSGQLYHLEDTSSFRTLECVQGFEGHTAAVGGCVMLGDDNTVLTCSEDFHVSRYNLTTTAREATFNYGAAVHCLAVQPVDHTVARAVPQLVFAGGADYVIKV